MILGVAFLGVVVAGSPASVCSCLWAGCTLRLVAFGRLVQALLASACCISHQFYGWSFTVVSLCDFRSSPHPQKKNASETAEYRWGQNKFALSGRYQLRRSSKQIGFVKHYVEITNCAVQATKLEWKSQSTSEIFANSISQILRDLPN